MSAGPHEAYEALLAQGEIKPDARQRLAVARLEALHRDLAAYAPRMGKSGWLERLRLDRAKGPPPRGVYLWGGVGRGKSMLMDLFFEAAPVESRKHVHFHAFMLEVHRRLHNFRQAVKAGQAPARTEPLEALARVIVDRAWLLCFDELHVTDIADAMILGRLFRALFDAGVVVVTTSNRPPGDLYKGGLQRELFLPFIALIEERLEVMELDGGVDYRLERMRAMRVYLTPLGAAADAALEEDFHRLTIGAAPEAHRLHVDGREVVVPRTAEGVAFMTFAELCGQPLGPADYLAVARRYHTLVLQGIPRMGPEKRDQAKRFVTLIDALYEAKTKLVCSAEALPEALYREGDGAFEFQRASSRLIEMQSQAYMALPHVR
jgi:cell division protein ZapE